MTYNIQGHSIDDAKVADIVKIIKSVDADVVAVQEVDNRPYIFQHDYLKDIADAAGMYYEFLPTVSNTYGIGLLSKIKPISVQTKIIPFSDQTKDKENRGLLVAEFDDFFFISTHYSLNADDRDTATDWVLDFTDKSTKAVFVAGDFNAKPTYRAMVTYQNYGYKILNNTSQFTFPSENPTGCIDMVLLFADLPGAIGYRVVANGIVRPADVDMASTSDHLPVYVRVRPISTAAEDIFGDDPVRIVNYPEGLMVNGLKESSMVSIFGSDGRLIKQINGYSNGLIDKSSFRRGYYIVNVKNGILNQSFKILFN